MPKQTSFQATEATQTQLAALRQAGYGTTTDIIRIAIDRMHREEKETMSTSQRPTHLYLDTSDDAMFGSETPPENADDLRKTFVVMVEQEIAELWPELDVEIVEVSHGQRVVFFDAEQVDDDRTTEAIINAVGQVYGNMEWAD